MQRFLKKDIAELLKSNLDRNAYGRAEGLYVELNLSSCYHYVEECCTCISELLKEMHKQSECPEECKVAVASLIYSAARFADLPELCDLRIQFYDKYGKALEPFANKEFAEKLKSKPPTMEMKIQLMEDIAQEFSVVWDPKPLEQQLQSPSMSTHDDHHANPKSSIVAAEDRKFSRTKSALVPMKENHDDSDKETDEEQTSLTAAKMRQSQSCCALIDKSHDQQHNKQLEPGIASSSSSSSDSEGNTNVKPFTNGIIPAPYTVTNTPNEDEKQDQNLEVARPRPKSVRTKFLKQSQSTVISGSEHETDHLRETLSARVVAGEARFGLRRWEKEMEEENKSPRTPTSATSFNSSLPLPPGRRRYFFPESQPASPLRDTDG